MKILYLINAGIMGGRERHVLTLVRSLPHTVKYVACAVSGGEATDAMREQGLNVIVLGGRSGHDVRILPRFIHLMRSFKPDVVHAHANPLLPSIVLKWLFPHVPFVESIHGPAGVQSGKRRQHSITRFLWGQCRRPDYYLPVSEATWQSFRTVCPSARGEVMLNALHLASLPEKMSHAQGKKIIGMVGRMADVKDWPSFLKIVSLVLKRRDDVEVWAIGDGPLRPVLEDAWQQSAHLQAIDGARLRWLGSRQDACALIGQMDVFLLTSKGEQLPTTLLEAFAMRTPVVGFLPPGGTSEVLGLAQGGRACAILHANRDCHAVADDVLRVLADDMLSRNLTDEGHRIVIDHFDLEKICRTQLVPLYYRLISNH